VSDVKHCPTTLAEALGDAPPITDPIVIQARQNHLAALAYGAADAGVELILAYHQGQGLSADGPLVQAFVTTLLHLDRGWAKFVRDTETDAEADRRRASRTCSSDAITHITIADPAQKSMCELYSDA
jgi:hypothetical protein